MRNFLTRRNDDYTFNFFDDVIDNFFKPVFFSGVEKGMRTDVREKDGNLEFLIDMPGYEKSDIKLTLESGYLTVSAKREQKEQDDDGFTRRERSVSCARSYFVGEEIDEEDVKAKYENGTLVLKVPKKEKQQIAKKHIEIE